MPMQPMRKLILLIVALLVGAGTIMLSRGMMTQPDGTSAPQIKVTPTYEILVTTRDLPAGTLLKETDLKWQVWPKTESATGFVVKDKGDTKEYVGTVVRNGMRAGEPFLSNRTVKPGDQGFMAAALGPGMRAVSIAITPVAGVAGFVFPGDRVDVIVTHQIGRKTEIEPEGRRVSETMLRNVRVLALDQKMNDQVSEPKVAQTATLEVTAKQAETVALISELGTVSLALRSISNDGAPEEPETKSVTRSSDLGSEAATSIPVEPAKPVEGTEQAAVPDIAIDAAALATKDGKQASDDIKTEPLTWDSDVSKVLPRPANRTGAVQKILIIRGKEATESVFDLQQP